MIKCAAAIDKRKALIYLIPSNMLNVAQRPFRIGADVSMQSSGKKVLINLIHSYVLNVQQLLEQI